MTNGSSERFDRIERILEETAVINRRTAEGLEQFREEVAVSRRESLDMTNGATASQPSWKVFPRIPEPFEEYMAKFHREMTARHHYRVEAFKRHDAEMKAIREVQAGNTRDIRDLVRIVENHQRRLEGLDGGESA